jgi:hypothetical protein
MANDKYLRIYLSDHLAGSSVGIEIAKRAAKSNADNDIGHHLRAALPVIEEDRATLERVMDLVGAPKHQWKLVVAWVGEKVGRLKLNGEVTTYSPLSRLVELEALSLGIRGKRAMWQSLREIRDPRLASIDFDNLIARADEQYKGVELQHRKASVMAFRAAE